MVLGTKERRITIAIGLIIGVSVSSMLVKHALEVKDEQAAQKPGNYDSLHSAVGGVKFPPLPQSIKQAIPRGIVVFFEGNRTSLCLPEHQKVNSWVIETTGSFRSERLFILAEADIENGGETRFLRASEIYVKLNYLNQEQSFKNLLNDEQYRVIGLNSSSNEYIVQVRKISPTDLIEAEIFLKSLSIVKSTRFPSWTPLR